MTSAVSPGPVPEVDLTLYWATENDLLDASIAAVQVRLPEWAPVEGNTEVVLLEGIALQVAQEIYALNQLPETVFEALLVLNGVTRQAGAAAQAQIAISTSPALSGTLVLPASSRFRAPLPDGTTVDFLTLAEETIPVGATDYPVWAQCETLGTAPRAIAAGTAVSGVATPTWIESAKIAAGGVTGGIDPESDQAYWTRGAAVLRRRPSALVIAQNFADAALDDQRVGRSAAWALWDGTGGTAGVGTDLGHVSVAVADDLGAALSAGAMAEIHDELAVQAQAGLTIHVLAPVFSVATVTASVVADSGVNKASLKTALEADVKAWLAPASWPWGKSLTTNDLIVRLGKYPGVAAVTSTGGTGWTGPSANPNGLFTANPTVTVTVA